MTLSIVDFIEARIREDEKWARLVSEPPSELDPEPADGVHWDWVVFVRSDYEPLDMPDPFSKEANGMLTETGTLAWLSTVEKYHLVEGDDPAPGIYSDGIHNMEGPAAAHIVRHDPARVLREVAAKRHIMERHCASTPPYVQYCQGCSEESLLEDCPELQDMAFVWNEHEDWNQEWCPHVEGRHEADVTEVPPARGCYTNACNRCGADDGWHYRDRSRA
jgi:hypothetical protein